jgi:hypothetical protein
MSVCVIVIVIVSYTVCSSFVDHFRFRSLFARLRLHPGYRALPMRGDNVSHYTISDGGVGLEYIDDQLVCAHRQTVGRSG